MSYRDHLLPEFDGEMKNTRRMIERVPSDKGEWKPHPKSFALGHLAQLVSWIPGWVASAASESSLDIAAAPRYSFEKTETLLKGFDENVRRAKDGIAKLQDKDLDQKWELKRGDMVLFSTTRGAALRQHVNHLSHHRGQLSVYLRLLDVPVPPVYGPTADEKVGFLQSS
jgi:uncharacterized damage-inducible protein DinB